MTSALRDYLADLVTHEPWAASTLQKIFASQPGTWQGIACICQDLPDALQAYRRLLQRCDSEIVAAWLPHPIQPDDAHLLVFYQDGEMEATVAIVSRTYLRTLGEKMRDRTGRSSL